MMDPTYIFQVIKSYLQIDPKNSPEAVFLRGAKKARLAGEQLIAKFLQTRGGKGKARMIKMMALHSRELGDLRETPKFTIVRLFGHMRPALLNASHELVNRRVFTNIEDVFFLHLWDLKALTLGDARNWQVLIAKRRETYQHEMRRKPTPRIMLSDGSVFYDAPASDMRDEENGLHGSPVSPGTAEGIVHIVLNPHGVQLAPGEILVCPDTDPAWTPLFLTACACGWLLWEDHDPELNTLFFTPSLLDEKLVK